MIKQDWRGNGTRQDKKKHMFSGQHFHTSYLVIIANVHIPDAQIFNLDLDAKVQTPHCFDNALDPCQPQPLAILGPMVKHQ